MPALDLARLHFPPSDLPEADARENSTRSIQPEEGLVRRSVRRTLQDQKSLYLAPFKPSNFKWDLLVLGSFGALLATDRRIEKHLPGGNVNLYSNISNVAIGTLSGALTATWIYGFKTNNSKAKDMGYLELETLVNTFLIYTPMQLIGARQRPGEGNGMGDFGKHHSVNTSFPAGHAMFTWAMASTVAHEYPKPWVKILAYGAATAVTGGRLLGRNHWASDTLLGSALGYFIGSHVFHTRCNPEFSTACHRSSDEE